MSDWRTIETAPKDGSVVIIFDQEVVGVGWYDNGLDINGEPCDPPQWRWFDKDEIGDANPTHWMPLPTPPTRNG